MRTPRQSQRLAGCPLWGMESRLVFVIIEGCKSKCSITCAAEIISSQRIHCAVIQTELGDHVIKHVCLTGELFAGSSRLFCSSRGGLNDSRDLLDTDGHLIHGVELLLGCAGDFQHTIVYGGSLFCHTGERVCGGSGKLIALCKGAAAELSFCNSSFFIFLLVTVR